MDFKFCTDRRMTAYVLTTPRRKIVSSTNRSPLSIIQASGVSSTNRAGLIYNDYGHGSQPLVYPDGGYNNYSTLPFSSSSSAFSAGDQEDKKSSREQEYWNVKYSYSIKVHVGVPNTMESLIKQQIRWKKSFIRSLSTTGGSYWKRPAYIAMIYYIMTVMKFVRPYVVFHAVFMLPLVGEFSSTILWLAGILFTSMIYGVDFKVRNPESKLWLYRPAFTLLTTFVYTWLLPVAMVNIRSKVWR
jgi:hyaluronan synthase